MAVALFAAGLATATATAETPLAVDAGDSRIVDGRDLEASVTGEAFGGQQPYTYQWTLAGASEPFADPTARSTTVNLSGQTGFVDLTLTVTDASGDTASDTVRYVVPDGVLADETVNTSTAVPDEAIGASGALDGQTREVPFTVPNGTGSLVGILGWEEGSGLIASDLDVVLVGPDGTEQTGNQGRTGDNPERVSVEDPQAGEWTARIEPWLSTGTEAHLTVVSMADVQLPHVVPTGPKVFGVQDEVNLFAEPRGTGTTVAWDLDHDGRYEANGSSVTADLPIGTHPIRIHGTDVHGLETTREITIEVTDRAEHALSLICGGRDSWDLKPLEYTASGGTCWMHAGHQTYDLGGPVTVVGGEGHVLSVEQQYSPSTEVENGTTPIVIETSSDGRQWDRVADVEYQFVEDLGDGVIGDELRQKIQFTFESHQPNAEFFRVHEPRSTAEGLSGFLDRTKLYLFVNDTAAHPPAAPTQPATETLTCEAGDVLEDFFADHPCTFGGINRYDAPSFFHTYPLGEGAEVSSVEASAEVAPWRTDDWFLPIVVSDDPESLQAYSDQVTGSELSLQVSDDGVTWQTLATAEVVYGDEQNFSVSLNEPVDADLVRLIPGRHPLFDDYRSNGPLHHPDAFFVSSQVTVTGTLPAGSR